MTIIIHLIEFCSTLALNGKLKASLWIFSISCTNGCNRCISLNLWLAWQLRLIHVFRKSVPYWHDLISCKWWHCHVCNATYKRHRCGPLFHLEQDNIDLLMWCPSFISNFMKTLWNSNKSNKLSSLILKVPTINKELVKPKRGMRKHWRWKPLIHLSTDEMIWQCTGKEY